LCINSFQEKTERGEVEVVSITPFAYIVVGISYLVRLILHTFFHSPRERPKFPGKKKEAVQSPLVNQDHPFNNQLFLAVTNDKKQQNPGKTSHLKL
jgi:cytoskeletal protein RodZ